MSSQAAFVMTSMLTGVVERGTASKAKVMGLRSTVAGKTGTTDGYRDAWFVGYTPTWWSACGWDSMTKRRCI